MLTDRDKSAKIKSTLSAALTLINSDFTGECNINRQTPQTLRTSPNSRNNSYNYISKPNPLSVCSCHCWPYIISNSANGWLGRIWIEAQINGVHTTMIANDPVSKSYTDNTRSVSSHIFQDFQCLKALQIIQGVLVEIYFRIFSGEEGGVVGNNIQSKIIL